VVDEKQRPASRRSGYPNALATDRVVLNIPAGKSQPIRQRRAVVSDVAWYTRSAISTHRNRRRRCARPAHHSGKLRQARLHGMMKAEQSRLANLAAIINSRAARELF